jgi:hypothetical protein
MGSDAMVTKTLGLEKSGQNISLWPPSLAFEFCPLFSPCCRRV